MHVCVNAITLYAVINNNVTEQYQIQLHSFNVNANLFIYIVCNATEIVILRRNDHRGLFVLYHSGKLPGECHALPNCMPYFRPIWVLMLL